MAYENYHTHMYLCTHAEGDTEDYVQKAISLGFKSLGMSDHGPLDMAGFPRMTLNQFYDIYIPGLDACKRKYEGRIKIYSGVEIEYMYGRNEYYKELREHLDYMVLGCHYYSGTVQTDATSAYCCNDPLKLQEYVTMAVTALDTGLFKIFAHPDFFMMGYPSADEAFYRACDEIALACLRNEVYLECNANGFSKGLRADGNYHYPNKDFFKYIHEKYPDVKFIISSDAHRPEDLTKDMDKADGFLSDLGIIPSHDIMEASYD